MIECAYIRFQEDLPVTDAAFALLRGFRAHGVPVKPFTDFEEIRLHITPETIVHGWVGDVLKALDQLGIPRPTFSSIPEGATELMGREVIKTTMDYVRNNEAKWPLFVKPIKHKLFTGHVISKFDDLFQTTFVGDAETVYVQPKVEFISEYRCFMHWDKVVAVRHYNGDCEVFPDMPIVEMMKFKLLAKQVMPAAYSLDIGILPDGKNVLVEMNDSFALGSYGLSWGLYLPMVHDRWTELVTPPAVWANHLVDQYLARKLSFHQVQTRFVSIAGDLISDAKTPDEDRASHAYLIWCEYTSLDKDDDNRGDQSWFRSQLRKRLPPNPTPL